ncbi:hypothetical protein SAMN02745220_03840 [Desulfopila aestuarii DSM 18488]|uniref:Uncharacterized protein n=1 Tax=Desulfopila aestuarii DSM 18488 TaxID=1121416 RepID=A0A1M7YEN3_9BACT|nr:hypothetical protein SAMN02745220_03840 [Desulfopila aestuarii DSM 18488]
MTSYSDIIVGVWMLPVVTQLIFPLLLFVGFSIVRIGRVISSGISR